MSDVRRPVGSTEDSRTWGEFMSDKWAANCTYTDGRSGPGYLWTPPKRHCRARRSKDGVGNLKPGFQRGGVERVKFHVLCAKLSHRAFISVNYRRKPSFDNPAFKTFPPLWLLSGIILPSPPPPQMCFDNRSKRHLDQRVLGWVEDSHWYVTANFERNLLHALKNTPSCSLAHGYQLAVGLLI